MSPAPACPQRRRETGSFPAAFMYVSSYSGHCRPSGIWRILRGFVFLVGVLFPQGAWAQPPVQVTPGFEHQLLGPHLDYLEDPTGTLELADLLSPEVASRFQPNDQFIFSAGLVESPFWFRFSITNTTRQVQKLILFQDYEFNRFDLYALDAEGEVQEVISKSLIEQLEAGVTRESLLGTPLTVPPEATGTYYLRLDTQFDMKALLSLWTPEARTHQDFREHHSYGWAWGGILIFIVFFLIIFLSLQERVYLYYSLFLLSFLSFRILERIWVDLFFFKAEWVYEIVLASIYATLVFGVKFSQNLLGIAQTYPRFNQAVNGALALLLGAILLSGDLFSAFAFIPFSVLALVPLVWIIGVLSWRQKNEVAPYFLSGLGVLAVASTAFPLMTLGVLNYHPLIRLSIELASLLDCLIFSIALSVRFRQTYQERDQSQRQAIERLRENGRLRNSFLASISHELRTPLHGIIGLTETVLREVWPQAKTGTQLKLILRSAKRLNRLVDNLLDVSFGPHKGLSIYQEPFSLAPLVQEILTLVSSQATHASVVLTNEVPTTLPPVYADHARIEQVLINLIRNAQKYAPEGGVTVRAFPQESHIRVEVLDRGRGVPEADRERIFHPFEQGKNASHHEEEGLGLGLSICREIIETHGGTIGVDEHLGGGSCFWFTLPQAPEEATASPPSSPTVWEDEPLELPDSLNQRSESSQGSVLLVDDELTNLYILMNHLLEMNLNIHSCTNGQEALDQWRSNEFDLILLDVRMPNMDGYEICEIIRQVDSKEKLPILFLSALTRSEDITLGLEAGANDYLFKPLVKAELQARVLSYLELARLRRAREAGLPPEGAYSKQELLALAMQTSVQVWEQRFGKDLVALAQESKLWGAYLDKTNSVWKTPSLRQYLAVSTIPSKPRWRKVSQTLEFLAYRLEESDPDRQKLLSLLTQILNAYS